MNRIIEYIIQAKDRTSAALQSALNRVKHFGDTVTDTMGRTKKAVENSGVEEKFVHTTWVLDEMGKAYERLGVSGQEFTDAMDVLERRLDNVNKTGEGQAELFEHIKASLEDFGASAKQCAYAEKHLQEGLVKVEKAAKDASGSMAAGFNPLRAITAMLHGNIGSLVREIAKLVPGVKNLGASGTMAIGAFGAAVMSVIKLVGALGELIKVAFNLGSMPKEITQASSGIATMVNNTENFYNAMNEARESTKKVEDSLREQITLTGELTKAQNELNRAKALSAAKTDEEREAINKLYDRMNAEAGAKTKGELTALQKKSAQAEGARLQQELEQALKDQEQYRQQMRKFNQKARHNLNSPMMETLSHIGHGFGLFGNTSTAKAQAWNRAAGAASNAYDDAVEKEAEIRKKIEENNRKLANLALREKVEKTEAAGEREKQVAEDVAEKQKEEAKKAAEYAKEIEKQRREQEKADRERQREEERKAREKEREELRRQREEQRAAIRAAREEEKKRHDEKVAELRSESQILRSLGQDERATRSALADASRKVGEAWGFYKDSGAMSDYIAEQEKEMNARRQYEKDVKALQNGSWSDELATAKRLNRRGETDKLEEMFAKWRSGSFGLSVEQEATMRVAVAKDEEKQAQKALEEIRDQIVSQAQVVEEIYNSLHGIEQAFEEGGE